MTESKHTDEVYMRRCIELAKTAELYVAPNPMVGAVLVSKDGDIVGEGWHCKYGEAHAEVNCFASVDEKKVDLHECTLYVSLEPCSHYGKTPPCALLVREKGVKRVVVGCLDPNPKVAGKGVAILQDAGIDVKVGVLADECRALNKRFLCLHEKHRPYVILKWAQTSDGFIDSLTHDDGHPLVISTPVTKQLVHQMRAENMSILVGTNTVVRDNPRLRVTHWTGRDPLRVTMDRHDRIPATAHIYDDDNFVVYKDDTSWEHILSDLAERNIHSLLVEGGATLLQSILDSGIYDEIHIEVSPLTIGKGVEAPKIDIHQEPTMCVDGHQMYTILHSTNY